MACRAKNVLVNRRKPISFCRDNITVQSATIQNNTTLSNDVSIQNNDVVTVRNPEINGDYGTLVIEKVDVKHDDIFTFEIDPPASGLLSTQVATFGGCGCITISLVTPGSYTIRQQYDNEKSAEKIVTITPGGKGTVSFI